MLENYLLFYHSRNNSTLSVTLNIYKSLNRSKTAAITGQRFLNPHFPTLTECQIVLRGLETDGTFLSAISFPQMQRCKVQLSLTALNISEMYSLHTPCCVHGFESTSSTPFPECKKQVPLHQVTPKHPRSCFPEHNLLQSVVIYPHSS